MSRTIVIGPNKCGTISLLHFFFHAGIKSVHYDQGKLARRMRENVHAGVSLFDGYNEHDAFLEINSACEHQIITPTEFVIPILDQDPDARFILNTRNLDRWIKSKHRHAGFRNNELDSNVELGCGVDRYCGDPGHCYTSASNRELHRRYYGFTDFDRVEDHWRAWWHNHMKLVQDAVPSDRLLVFDIEQDDPQLLCKFLRLPTEYSKYYTHRNVTLPSPLARLTGLLPRRSRARRGARHILGQLVVRWRRYPCRK